MDARERRRALRPNLDGAFLALFEERLPVLARVLAGEAPAPSLAEAVALYHLVLEGVVFTAGQHALLGLLVRAEPPLPGLARGVELMLADERWHIGFGARLLEELAAEPSVAERLLCEGRAALAVCGDAIDAEVAERAIALHGRRLRAAAIGAAPLGPSGAATRPLGSAPARTGAPRAAALARPSAHGHATESRSSGPPLTPFATATS